MNWIRKVLKAVENTESPRNYITWSCLCAISAVVKKNLFLSRQGKYKLYPNIYVFLIGKSGLRKGFPISIAKKLVVEVNNTRVIWGRASFQGIIKEISNATTLSSGLILDCAQAFIASGEFAGSLVRDEDALTFFTDIYNTHEHEPKWEGFLKSETKTILKEPCITWIGASNEIHFRDKIDTQDIQGGFIARSMIIVAEKKYKNLSLMDGEPDEEVNYKDLAEHLVEISKLKGQFTVADVTKREFDKWYLDFCDRLEKGEEDKTGTLERIHDQILKVAMLVSLSHGTDLIINSKHMEEAMQLCFDTIPGMKRTTMGQGLSEIKDQTSLIIKKMLAQKEYRIDRKRLLVDGWGDYDTNILDRVVETLLQAGMIKIISNGNNPTYAMKESAVEQYMKFKQEVQ